MLKARKELRLSLAALSKATGISTATLNRMERNGDCILSKVRTVSAFLAIPIDDDPPKERSQNAVEWVKLVRYAAASMPSDQFDIWLQLVGEGSDETRVYKGWTFLTLFEGTTIREENLISAQLNGG